jgi:cyclic pyranopterin phosphate synthase
MVTLVDKFGRPCLNLRVSVTQLCNLRCLYCHREGENSAGSSKEEMSKDEIVKMVRIAVQLGMHNVKLTGGEPLVREGILEIVKDVSGIRGLRDLSMTTNGTFLADLAESLSEAGLMRVNVNLPTLDRTVYRKVTGGTLQNVLDGIRGAVYAGLYPVKLNMLVLRGVNNNEVKAMMNFAKQTGTILQLIELEPLNISKEYYQKHHMPLDKIEMELDSKATEVKTRRFMQNRRVYHLPGLKVEVIHPIENTEFCMHCTRLRVTRDGKLKPCLMRNDNLTDILTPLRSGASDEELIEIFRETCLNREPYYKELQQPKILTRTKQLS